MLVIRIEKLIDQFSENKNMDTDTTKKGNIKHKQRKD